MISNVDIKAVENLLGQWLKEKHHVMDVLAVDHRWLLKYVRLWEPRFLKKQLRNLAPALDLISLDYSEAEAEVLEEVEV
jgi:hypothetical protein